jgi:hypothetical protein
VVQLIHTPSEFYVIGTSEKDNGYDEEVKPCNIYLRRELEEFSISHKWIIMPRYRLRNEGDPVRCNDHIILRNAQHKHLVITSFPVPEESGYEHLVGLDRIDNCLNKTGLKIIRVIKSPTHSITNMEDQISAEKENYFLKGNDFIRIGHREFGGHLICRLNDEKEVQSVVTPFGSVSRKSTAVKDHTHLVVVRPVHMQQPRVQHDFATSLSSLGIWQIILVKSNEDGVQIQGKIKRNAEVRLRHLVSGQYLSVRPAVHADIDLLIPKRKRKQSSTKGHQQTNATFTSESLEEQKHNAEEPEAQSDVDSIHFGDDDPGRNQPVTFKLAVREALVPDLKKMDWVGKNNPYLQFVFANKFKAQTEVVEDAQKYAKWDLRENYQGMEFAADNLSIMRNDFQVTLMNKHSLFQDSLIGRGTLSLESIKNVTKTGSLSFTVELHNKRNRKVGVVNISFDIEREFSPEDFPEDGETHELSPIKKGPEVHFLSPQGSGKVPNFGDAAPPTSPSRNFEWIVATTSTPNDYTTFCIKSLNTQTDLEDPYLHYEDNIFFESIVLKHRFQLVPPGQLRHPSKWWEYKEDARLDIRQSAMEDYIIDSEVFLLERVAIEEVQDTIYASRVLPLARAATVSLQLTPSVGYLYTPLFRHFKKYLNTLTLWSLGVTENDGSLMSEDGPYEQAKIAHNLNDLFEDVFSEDDQGFGASMLDVLHNFTSHSRDPQDATLLRTEIKDPSKQIPKPKLDKTKFISSSMYPWLGRTVGTDFYSSSDETALDHYVEFMVDDIVKTAATSPVIVRRQAILFDIKLMEQLMHFLNVFFILQRAISYSQSTDVLADYAGLPLLVQQCCHAVHLFLRATVHCNERNALKLLSIRGTLLSLISQKILGWNPPLESIVRIAFESADATSEADSGPNGFKLEDVLTNSITSSDIRQILEQMSEMNSIGDPNASNLLSLLTLLCEAGKAKRYFQNILIRYLVSCEPEVLQFSPESSFGDTEPFSRKHECLLFKTEHRDSDWVVQFQSNFVLPAQEARNEEFYRKELLIEGESLRLLFFHYNNAAVDNDILDLEECFLLLEDLGFGGPFLYEEIGRLMGANLWGFLLWWCYRSSFYYPSSSVAHSQISPIQAMKLIDPNVDVVFIMMEFNRRFIDRDSIMRSLRFQSIISSRIPGFSLIFRDPSDHPNHSQSMYWKTPIRQLTKGYKHNPIRKMRTAKLNDVISKQFKESKSFLYALITPPMNTWFRGSLRLLAAICTDSNTLCQRIVSLLLPAECILFNLQIPTLSPQDKSLLCDLLTNIYIDNSFVFPTRCIPVRRSTLFCAMDEDIYNPNVSIGKVFNPLSRLCYDEPCFEEGSLLRTRLFEFIKRESASVVIFSEVSETMNYTRALLKLYRRLLHQGFFGEADFEFLDFAQILETRTYFFAPENHEVITIENPSTLSEFELVVMTKLIESKEIHREQDFHVGEGGAGVAEREARDKTAKNRRKLMTIFEDLTKFDKIFLDSGYSTLVYSAVSALREFMEIKQMYRVQMLWNHVGQFAAKYSLLAYTSDWPNLDKCFEDQALYGIFDTLINEKVDEKTCIDAVMTGVLHPDKRLIEECLKLLNSRLSLYHGIYELIDITTFFVPSTHSVINRLISFYFKNLIRCISEIVESLHQERDHLYQLIDFFIENVYALLFRCDLEKFNQTLSGQNQGSSKHRKDSVYDNEKRFRKDREKIILYYIISSKIPCPVGEDDFFLLELKEFLANEENVTNLNNQYDESQTTIKSDHFQWKIDATVPVTKFTEVFLSLIVKCLLGLFAKTDDDPDKPVFHISNLFWDDVPMKVQTILEKVFSFLAMLWKEYDSTKHDGLPKQWFPEILDLLLPLYPDCIGATSFLHVLVQHSTNENVYVDPATVEELIVRLSNYPTHLSMPIRFRLMMSLVTSKNDIYVEKGSILMIDSLGEFFMTKFRLLEELKTERGKPAFTTLAYQTLLPVFNALTAVDKTEKDIFDENHERIKNDAEEKSQLNFDGDIHEIHDKHAGHYLPEEIVTGLTMFCSHDFCGELLESPAVNLHIKGLIIRIALKLYSIDEFPLEELVLKEIRSIRLYFHLLKEQTEMPEVSGIRSFFFIGVFPFLKFRILETKILSKRNINAFIVSELTNQKSKLFNQALGEEVIGKAALLYPFEASSSKKKKSRRARVPANLNSDTLAMGSSFLPSEVVTSLMISLNIFAYQGAHLLKQCTQVEKKDLIWIVAAVLLYLQSRPDFISTDL